MALVVAVAFGAWGLLSNLSENIMFFLTPTELQHRSDIEKNKNLKIGGVVRENSINHTQEGNTLITTFILTDYKTDILVTHIGALPMLFKEKQGIVALGYVRPDGVFVASELLTKHDEKYKPPTIK